MKKIYLLALAVILGFTANAQDKESADKVVAQIAKERKIEDAGWKKGNIVNISGSQTYLNDFWQAGGISSIAVNGLFSGFRNYTKGKNLWENKLDLELGSIKLGFTSASKWRKANDRVDLTTEYGRQLKEKWYLSALGNFRTQILKGYNYEQSATNYISNAFAPAYLTAAIGIKYKQSDNFKIFFSPIAYRATIVTDNTLIANSTVDLFGVETTKGKKLRNEIGALFIATYQRKLMDNITFKTDLTLYANYLKNPQNIDVYWNTLIDMQVNKYISVNLGTNLVYDDDILIALYDKNNVATGFGPRTQFKQFLNVGLKYQF